MEDSKIKNFKLLFNKYKKDIIKSIILTIFITLLSTIIISYSGKILASFNIDTFSKIFSQLRDADIVNPFIIPLVSFFFIILWLRKFSEKKLYKKILAIFIFIGLFSLLLIYEILFCKVNGILLIDVIFSLIRNLGGLGL